MSSSSSSSSKSAHLVDRLRLLLSTGEDADVHFLVGDGEEKELLPAHKLLLKSASEVFAAMFRFDAKKAKSAVAGKGQSVPAPSSSAVRCAAGGALGSVEVSDVAVDAFKVMLSFIYAEDLSGLNGDNAMAVLYAAKKYNVQLLAKACLDFPISELSNVFLSFSEARFLGERDFARRCLTYIQQNAQSLLKSDAFLEIGQKLLYEILNRDHLNVDSETDIWNAALRWADEKCRRKGDKCSTENRRAVLGLALYKIRFPLMPKEEFSKNIAADTKCHGTLLLVLNRLSEFAREDENSERISDTEHTRGLSWKMVAFPTTKTKKGAEKKYLGFSLKCSTKSPNSVVSCSATLRIVSREKDKEDYMLGTSCDVSKSNTIIWGVPDFIQFEELMDTNNGWYTSAEDTVTLEVDVATTTDAAPNGAQKRRWSDAF